MILKIIGGVKMTVEDLIEIYPKVVKEDKYILIAYKGTYAENLVNVYDTEIEALRVAQNLPVNARTLIHGNALYLDLEGQLFYYGYEEIQ